MNKLYFLPLLFVSCFGFSQSIGNINSSAISGNSSMISVGEIYIIPNDENSSSSGTMGLISQTNLSFLGADEIIVNNIKTYPNPTTNYLNFSYKSEKKLQEIEIFDFSGKNIKTLKINNNMVDLTFLPKGTYIIKFKNTTVQPIKIIKN